MQKAGGAKARLFVYLNEHELKGENSGRVKKIYSHPINDSMDSTDMSYDY